MFQILEVEPGFEERHAKDEVVRKILHDNYTLPNRQVAELLAANKIWQSMMSAEKGHMQKPPPITAKAVITKAQCAGQRQVYQLRLLVSEFDCFSAMLSRWYDRSLSGRQAPAKPMYH